MDLKQHLLRQMAWSHANFGPGQRNEGVIDHIRKELVEVEESHGEAAEWVDVVILALDGLTRRLAFSLGDGSRRNPEEVAQMACNMIIGKQSRNEGRTWPDWRTAEQGKAIEHVKTARFEEGQIVRYGDGETALARIESPHAGGYHATQCLGGGIFVSGSKLRLATGSEIDDARKSKFWALG